MALKMTKRFTQVRGRTPNSVTDGRVLNTEEPARMEQDTTRVLSLSPPLSLPARLSPLAPHNTLTVRCSPVQMNPACGALVGYLDAVKH